MFAKTHAWHDGSLYDCLLYSMARYRHLMIKRYLSLLLRRMCLHSEWLESISPTDRHGRDALDFCNLSGCVGNRLDLVMTDASNIVDVFVGTPLGTSDYSFVSCVHRVEQSLPEYNDRSNVFLKHRANWNNCAVRTSTTR